MSTKRPGFIPDRMKLTADKKCPAAIGKVWQTQKEMLDFLYQTFPNVPGVFVSIHGMDCKAKAAFFLPDVTFNDVPPAEIVGKVLEHDAVHLFVFEADYTFDSKSPTAQKKHIDKVLNMTHNLFDSGLDGGMTSVRDVAIGNPGGPGEYFWSARLHGFIAGEAPRAYESILQAMADGTLKQQSDDPDDLDPMERLRKLLDIPEDIILRKFNPDVPDDGPQSC